MLVTEIYNGQGLGNQLACYVTTRVLALDKGFKFGIMSPHKLKCNSFISLDVGEQVHGGSGPEGGPPETLPQNIKHYYRERAVTIPDRTKTDIRLDDPGLELIQDNTKLDGYFQSENRIFHRKKEIKEWLKVHKDKDNFTYSAEDTCIINFRGGEYVGVPEFFLPIKYWQDSIRHMSRFKPGLKYVVVTDDPFTARRFFSQDFLIFHNNIWDDYTVIKNAHYAILSNSSFPYFPIFTSDTIKYIIAPKYWGRHNISDGYWSLGYNIYRDYNYIDREGNISTYEQCVKEFSDYKKRTKHYA
jgi:hypothetical protein